MRDFVAPIHRLAVIVFVALAPGAALAQGCCQAEDWVDLPVPYEAFDPADFTELLFPPDASNAPSRLIGARLWETDGKTFLAVLAERLDYEAEAFCSDCRNPVLLGVFATADNRLRLIALSDAHPVTPISWPSLQVEDFLDQENMPRGLPFIADHTLLAYVHRSDDGRRRQARIALYRLAGGALIPVFWRDVLDDTTESDPDAEGTEAWVEAGDLPEDADQYASIEVSEGYFSLFAGEKIELDGQRVEVWEFDGARYVMRECEDNGGAGITDCMK